MRCPFCNNRKDRVVDSRESKEGNVIRRRRECLNCKRRFTSYERIEEVPYVVVKKGGSRESFDRSKLLKGLLKACEKRPVPAGQLEEIVEEVEQRFPETPDRELTSQEIGEYSMGRLKEIDKVAYVRFASVYLEFKDVREFMREINQLFERGK
ncbi:MAG: transcriptional regulator NrdR [Acidobacteriota bacterium]